jgi:hypothetical protein
MATPLTGAGSANQKALAAKRQATKDAKRAARQGDGPTVTLESQFFDVNNTPAEKQLEVREGSKTVYSGASSGYSGNINNPLPSNNSSGQTFSFQYVDTQGKLKTVSGSSEEEAKKLATDIDPKSGFMKIDPVYAAQKENGITSSSGNARMEESRLGSTITTLSAPAYSTPARSTKYIDDYERSLSQLLAASERDINAGWEDQRRSTQEAQASETGATSAALARMGGYLGGSASGTGAMLKLSAGHRAELSSLESKRNAALTEARLAFSEKRFDAAKAKAAEAKWWEEESYKRQQDFFDNQRALLSDERTERNQERDDARAVLTNIINNTTGQDWNDMSPEAQALLEQNAARAGYPLDVIKSMMAMPKAQAARVDQLVKDAAKKGAPPSILSAIAAAGSFAEAAAIASPYIATGGGGVDGTGNIVSIPEYDQFVLEFLGTPGGQEMKAQIEAAGKINYTPEQLLIELKNNATVRSIYDATVAQVQSSATSGVPFTATEKKKLEQAGLLNATRQAQLDYLYGKTDSAQARIDSLIE